MDHWRESLLLRGIRPWRRTAEAGRVLRRGARRAAQRALRRGLGLGWEGWRAWWAAHAYGVYLHG